MAHDEAVDHLFSQFSQEEVEIDMEAEVRTLYSQRERVLERPPSSPPQENQQRHTFDSPLAYPQSPNAPSNGENIRLHAEKMHHSDEDVGAVELGMERLSPPMLGIAQKRSVSPINENPQASKPVGAGQC